MMQLMESIFDIAYLVFVIGLGIRLLLLPDRRAKCFGTMGVLLGLGDAFHLLPRVMAHLSTNGFERFAAELSWGQLVTSITMTIFYVIYYRFLRREEGHSSKALDLAVYGLALARIVLCLMPGNAWGTGGDYAWGIYRNIPFLVLGVLLIVPSLRSSKRELRMMGLWILLSFAFYLPVVLFVDSVPALGALMLPKTVAYVMLIVTAWRAYGVPFSARSFLDLSIVFFFLGMGGGVFYREFTKAFAFTEGTRLALVHPHSLVLGMIVCLILYALAKNDDVAALKRSCFVYIGGVWLSVVMLVIGGLVDVLAVDGKLPFVAAAFSGMAGLGHIALAVGLGGLLFGLRRLHSRTH